MNIKNLKVNKKISMIAAGTILTGAVMIGSVSFFKNSNGPVSSSPTVETTALEEKTPIEVTEEDLSELNLVFDNSGMEDYLYHQVLSQLREKNIPFRENQEGLPVESKETIISLTSNPYVDGPVALYGPMEHEYNDNDNLMVSFKTACEHQDCYQERIHFGRIVKGEIEKTTLEEKMDMHPSMLTLQFKEINTGDHPFTTVNADDIAKLIKEGITRYCVQRKYAKGEKYFDVIQPGETLSGIAQFYRISLDDLKNRNELESSYIIPVGTVVQLWGNNTDALDVNHPPVLVSTETKSKQ